MFQLWPAHSHLSLIESTCEHCTLTLVQGCTPELHFSRYSTRTNKIKPLHEDIPGSLHLILVRESEVIGWVRQQFWTRKKNSLVFLHKSHYSFPSSLSLLENLKFKHFPILTLPNNNLFPVPQHYSHVFSFQGSRIFSGSVCLGIRAQSLITFSKHSQNRLVLVLTSEIKQKCIH